MAIHCAKKGHANCFILFVAFLTLFTLMSSLSPFTLSLNVTEVLVILCCTMMTTIPLTLIIYTKKQMNYFYWNK
ncbi:hypothetical protein [Kurthia massiliensis]|uniref:hypothetical protein n=1 Tax=Kurthia massiliensis TaxID=1033739 RepID=UPI00028A3F3F|nr:hypothetical protein [Kurthia massiliensis]